MTQPASPSGPPPMERRAMPDIGTKLADVEKYVDVLFRDLQAQIDRRLQAEHREHDEFRAHLAEIFAADHRATEIAEREREKASDALRDEQHRATDSAEREREKAAQALSRTLAQSIQEGDERLREHIQNQVEQINAALVAVEGRAVLRHDAIGAEFHLRQKASDAAVQKAEDNQKDVNERSNEFRGQLKDQNATMMPRSEAEALLKELRLAIDRNDEKLIATNTRIEKWDGRKVGGDERSTEARASTGAIVGLVSAGVAVVGLVIVLANVLTTH